MTPNFFLFLVGDISILVTSLLIIAQFLLAFQHSFHLNALLFNPPTHTSYFRKMKFFKSNSWMSIPLLTLAVSVPLFLQNLSKSFSEPALMSSFLFGDITPSKVLLLTSLMILSSALSLLFFGATRIFKATSTPSPALSA